MSKETHELTKQETLLGRGTRAESSRARNPGGLLCPMACSLRFYGDRVSFGLSLANHSDSGSFLVASASLSQDGYQ